MTKISLVFSLSSH